jgi:hypothetical protein
MQSIAMIMFLDAFKVAAAEGAAVELKLRLLAGKIPALQGFAYQKKLRDPGQCFWICRTDGTNDDFSIGNCITQRKRG